jgi:diguanylate cyclase (GGDEF)-like protein
VNSNSVPTSPTIDRSGPTVLNSRRLQKRYFWMAVASLVVAIGIGTSVFGFSVVRGGSSRAQKAFTTSTGQIASQMRLALQHEQDLVTSTESFIIGDPHPTPDQFTSWATQTGVLARYPELRGLAVIAYVRASQLKAYAAGVTDNPDTPFSVVPPGRHSYYCFLPVEIGRSASENYPVNFNLCTGAVGRKFLAARDSGISAAVPYKVGKTQTLALEVPIYTTGAVPPTVAARRRDFVELVGINVLPNMLVRSALHGHPGTALSLRYGTGASSVVFSGGHAGVGERSLTVQLHDGSSIETRQVLSGAGPLGSLGGLPLLAGGIALSLLLGALIFVLGAGRARSMGLADKRTGELEFQALHDALTGLPNRALVVDRIDQLVTRSRRNGTACAALYIDLDDFKNVNDSLGHELGDELLAAVGERMAGTLREADTIGRMGGDEFAVLIDGSETLVAPELVAERLLDVMRQPFELEGSAMPLHVSASIGIAVGTVTTGGELLRHADIALHQAKVEGKNRYEFFRTGMQSGLGRRIQLEFDLRSALPSDQFHLVYQPIYDLQALHLVGVEALLRWDHPAEGELQPDDFVPILEQTGLIREVGAWVLHEACRQAAAWHARGHTLTVSVNVSGRQLDDDRIVNHIGQALAASGLKASALIVEVTETALMLDATSAIRRLQAIRDLGVSISVDDFGTGYSSLAYLQRFPVNCIKIDRAFVSAMTESPESRALIRTFVQLGRDLGLKTLAEGVETSIEMDLLRADQVDEAQGYLFARPLDPTTLEAQFLTPSLALHADREGN